MADAVGWATGDALDFRCLVFGDGGLDPDP